MFTIYTQSEILLWGLSNGDILIRNGVLLQELWAGWIRMTLCKFKLRCYPFCSASSFAFRVRTALSAPFVYLYLLPSWCVSNAIPFRLYKSKFPRTKTIISVCIYSGNRWLDWEPCTRTDWTSGYTFVTGIRHLYRFPYAGMYVIHVDFRILACIICMWFMSFSIYQHVCTQDYQM